VGHRRTESDGGLLFDDRNCRFVVSSGLINGKPDVIDTLFSVDRHSYLQCCLSLRLERRPPSGIWLRFVLESFSLTREGRRRGWSPFLVSDRVQLIVLRKVMSGILGHCDLSRLVVLGAVVQFCQRLRDTVIDYSG
jgi:hypothetical protein